MSAWSPKPKTTKAEVEIPATWDKAKAETLLSNLCKTLSLDELNLLTQSAQNPVVKKMALSALKNFN